MGCSDTPKISNSSIIEFRTCQCRALKGLFDALKDHIVDINFLFSKSGVKVLQTSASSIFIAVINLEADNFEHYYYREHHLNDNSFEVINLSLANIHKIFKAVNQEDNLITWIYERDDADDSDEVISIRISSDKKNEERQYNIKMQEPEDDTLNNHFEIDTNEYDHIITISCTDLQHICRDLKNQGAKYVEITHDGKSLTFATKTDVCASKIIRRKCDDDNFDTDGKMFTKTSDNVIFNDRYRFDPLNSFTKCAQTGSSGAGSNNVRIHLKQTEPLVLEFDVGSLGTLTIAIAPCTNEDD